MPTTTIQLTDLRRRVREVLDRVRIEQEPIIVQTYDTPQAVLIPYDEFEAYEAWRERRRERAAWLAELRGIAEEVSERAVLSDAEAQALIDEAVRATRASSEPSWMPTSWPVTCSPTVLPSPGSSTAIWREGTSFS